MQGNLMHKHQPGCDQNLVKVVRRSETLSSHNRKKRTEKKGYTKEVSKKKKKISISDITL